VGRDIVLLTNPASGRGRGSRTAAIVVPRLREAGFQVHSVEGRDAAEASELARGAVGDGVEALVVVGGDGMVHLAVQAVAGTGVALGIVPAGTGNDAARLLGIPRGDPQLAADVVVASHVRTVDLGRAGGTYFVNVLSTGFDAVVSERALRMRWPQGQLRYAVATFGELRVFRPLPYVLDFDGRSLEREAMLVAVGNGPTFGGGLRITEGAEVDDGLLDVVVINAMSKGELVRTYPKLYRGTHVRHPAYEHHRVRSVTVGSPGVVAYADGERIGPLPLTARCEPGALRVLAPAPAPDRA
jgi:diacylglycerol kinase (ATP)